MTITVSTPATVEPIDIDAAKEQLQLDHTDDDGYVLAIIKAARAVVENYTGRALIQRTVAIDLDANEAQSPLDLPLGKLQSISSFVYYDTAGNSTAITTDDYYIAATNPGRIVAQNAGWTLQRSYKAATITAVIGYGAASSAVPDDIIHALKIVLRDLWENSDFDADSARINPVAKILLEPYRLITPFGS